jgi:uncharacterized membrane protein YqaE (UPF0057 family)
MPPRMVPARTGAGPCVISLPENRASTRVGLLLLCICCPPLAVYLDGGSPTTVLVNTWLSVLLMFPAVIHAWCYILRPTKRRMIARPMRYRLWIQYSPTVAKQVAESIYVSNKTHGNQPAGRDVFSRAPSLPTSLTLPAIMEQPDSGGLRRGRALERHILSSPQRSSDANEDKPFAESPHRVLEA